MAHRLVLVHGFTQTGRSWDPLIPLFGDHFDVVTPDLPGHGSRADIHAGMDEAVRLLAEDGGKGAYVGYSMGGRLCLHLALAEPGRVLRLVLLGATAGIEDPRERAARRAADDRMADDIERDGADAFLERWLSHPMFGPLSEPGPRTRDAAVLAACLRRLGTGVQEPLWSRLPELSMPAVAPTRTRRRTRYGAASARCRHSRPPIEYPT